MEPLFDLIISHIKEPSVNLKKPFAMLATLLASDPYLGRCLIGRVEQGEVKVNDIVKTINLEGKEIEKGIPVKHLHRWLKLFTHTRV